MSEFKCQRCGKCCISVGRTFWKHGNLELHKQFGDCDYLNKLANNKEHEDNGLPCEMLLFENNIAICLIERDFGNKYKPIACIEYPEAGEKCFNEKELINSQ